MSWQKFSSSGNATANNSKQKKIINASKVFVDNIIVNHKTDIGSIDISNLYFKDSSYSSTAITIKEFMRGPDLSVNKIGVQNDIDTSGVVKFMKPIRAPAGAFNQLKGHDASFEVLSVSSTINVRNVSSRKDGSNIVVHSNADFSTNVEFTDICINQFNLNDEDGTLVFLGDVSLSTIDGNLHAKDVSVNVLENRREYPIEFKNDIVSGNIITYDLSTEQITVSDISVNEIRAQDFLSINIRNDVSVNGNVSIDTINVTNITSDVRFFNDISINKNLKVNKITTDSVITNSTNSNIEFKSDVELKNALQKNDISVNIIKTTEDGGYTNSIVPIIPSEIDTITTYGLTSERVIVIDGDISINGSVTADWEKTGMNIIPTITKVSDLVKNAKNYVNGQFVILRNDKTEFVYIKTGELSWHRILISNAAPLYTKFVMGTNNTDNSNIYINDDNGEPKKDVSYSDVEGIEEDTNITFHIRKYKGEDFSYNLDISYIDVEDKDPIKFTIDNSINDYDGGVSWGISLDATDSEYADISRVIIRPPNSNGVDFSFTITIEEDRDTNTVPTSQKVILKKLNDQPVWTYIKMSVSNDNVSVDQSWNATTSKKIYEKKDLSNQFYLYFEPNKEYVYSSGPQQQTDLSSYYLDLSALDIERFDVSYDVSNVKGDLSFSFVDYADASRIVIDISDHAVLGTDTSFEIISIDDWEDRPNPYKRIVNFKFISSAVLTEFSYNNIDSGTVKYNSVKYNSDNSYQIFYYPKDDVHMIIEPSFNITKYDDVDEPDFSINDITYSVYDSDIDISITTQNKIGLKLHYKDVSFNFLLDSVFKYKLKIINYYMSNGTGRFKNIVIGYEDGYTLTTDRRLDISGNVDISGNLDISGALTVNGSPVGGGVGFRGFCQKQSSGAVSGRHILVPGASTPPQFTTGGWDHTTGIFTAGPDDVGVWEFSCSFNLYSLASNPGGQIMMNITQNDTGQVPHPTVNGPINIASSYVNSTTAYHGVWRGEQMFNIHGLANLIEGSQVYVFNDSTYNWQFYSPQNREYFYGHKLGNNEFII